MPLRISVSAFTVAGASPKGREQPGLSPTPPTVSCSECVCMAQTISNIYYLNWKNNNIKFRPGGGRRETHHSDRCAQVLMSRWNLTPKRLVFNGVHDTFHCVCVCGGGSAGQAGGIKRLPNGRTVKRGRLGTGRGETANSTQSQLCGG